MFKFSRRGTRRFPKLELKLKLSPPRSSTESMDSSPPRSSTSSSSSTTTPSSRPLPLEREPIRFSNSPPKAPMFLVGCPQCLTYVMLSSEDPKCPRCNRILLLDFLDGPNAGFTKKVNAAVRGA